jgi:hypothetical protein
VKAASSKSLCAGGWLTPAHHGDEPAIMDRIAAIFSGSLRSSEPPALWIVRIDNFFDARWFRFAGKMLGAVGVHSESELVLPPFHPHRVIGERHLQLVDGAYVPAPRCVPLHVSQNSARNLRNIVTRGDRSAGFLWFSSGAADNGMASAMSYVVDGKNSFAWYATFERDLGWQAKRVVGATREELDRFELLAKGTG